MIERERQYHRPSCGASALRVVLLVTAQGQSQVPYSAVAMCTPQDRINRLWVVRTVHSDGRSPTGNLEWHGTRAHASFDVATTPESAESQSQHTVVVHKLGDGVCRVPCKDRVIRGLAQGIFLIA